ncbi:putative repeat protein (TIGR01451 family) [Pedobacter agri]|nr:putative repeat protein (TIGR01451 family) [Pedobacter agri]
MKSSSKLISRSLKIVIAFVVTVLISHVAYSQQVPFTPRTSQKAPGNYKGKATYNLQGDFVMVGNTNLTLSVYNDNVDNSSSIMKYVDIDNDPNTFNSSSADLQFGTDAACTKIIFAGLYWTGRAHNDNDNSPNVFNVTKNGVTKSFNKRKVKLKGPNGGYQEVTAGTNDIYFPTSGNRVMYSAYADVTDYVIAQGIGNYTVADIAINEGTSDGTGFYGGWGMVVIYENPTKVWRDITVFDGNAFLLGSSSTALELPVTGFQAVKNGPVNIKMGMMAGEGDRNITGDYFKIRNAANNAWVTLNHTGNTGNNFFNSSIVTGGNARNPNLSNNTGIDVSMFNLANSGNSIISNNQVSTRFQYGSTQDTYSIFNIVFAVDAYIPEVQVFNANQSSVSNNDSVDPNQTIEFTSTIYNKGTEPISNGVVEIPLPHNVHYVSSNVTVGSGTSVVWSHPSGATDPNITPGGKLTWTVGNLIKPTDPNTILAQLKYRIRVTNDCTILTTGGACGLVINLDGTFKGTGTNSGIAINNGFVIGYNADCGNTPIRDPFQMNIVPSQAFIDNCPVGVNNGTKQFKAFCSSPGNAIQRSTITSAYPLGSKFYSVSPAVAGYTTSLISENFPVTNDGNPTAYYAVLEGMAAGCFLKLETLTEIVTTQPTVNNLNWCAGSPVAFNNQLSPAGAANGNQLYYFANANDTTPLSSVPNPTAAGTYNYFVAEGLTKNGTTCFGPKVPFRVDVYALPIITQNLAEDFFVCADDAKTISIQSNATTVVWEYFNTNTSSWSVLTANTFVDEVTPTGSEVKFTSPSIDRDQLKIRAKLTSSNSCTIYSKEVTIEVRLCNIITNPMLPAKIIKN